MRVMKVLGLTLDGTTNAPILVLQQEDGDEVLPIWLGAAEAMAISMALNDLSPDRPLTHPLLIDIMTVLGARVNGVSITDLRNGTFYALLELQRGSESIQLDCRPSDGIILALRTKTPIRIASSVLLKAARDRVSPSSSEADKRPSDMGDQLILGAMPPAAVQRASLKGSSTVPAALVEDQNLSDLLQNLEPASKRVM